MATIDLTKNFNDIIDSLMDKKYNISQISKMMGYTSSSQLHNAMDGGSMLSTKAIISLIENASVNPTFLFFGTGEIFLSEVSELEKLRNDNQELTQKLSECGNMVSGLREVIKKLEKRNEDLIEISSAAIKYHKSKNEGQKENLNGGSLESK